RQPAYRRYRLRLAAVAGRLRAGPDAVRHDAGAEHRRPLHRPPLPGAVRIATANTVPTTALPADAEQRKRLETIRAGLGRRHARETRFRAYGIAAIAAA